MIPCWKRKAWFVVLPLAVLGLAQAPRAEAAGINPREVRSVPPPPEALPVTDPDQMGEWLMRLVGRYRIEGSLFMPTRTFLFRNTEGEETEGEFESRFEQARGTGDCASVGAGPGVSCIFNVSWQEQYEIIMDPDAGPVGVWHLPEGVPYLNPAALLMGMDLANQRLAYLLVNRNGLPEGGAGSIAGDRATFRSKCVNAPPLLARLNPAQKFDEKPPLTCDRITHIDAKPDGRSVEVSITVEINDEMVALTRLTLRRLAADGSVQKETRRRQ